MNHVPDRIPDDTATLNVDVVVVTFDSREHARACIEPLSRHPALSVIVVDNNSSDRTLETVADLPVKVIARTDNRGFGFACNVGWRAGEASTVVFLNPDSSTDYRSILALADRLESDARFGVVGPQIVDPQGNVQLSQRRFPSFLTSLAAAFFVPRMRPSTRWSLDIADANAYRHPNSPDWISGACIAVRRELLEKIDGFDERFFMYYEDADLCRRIRDGGFDVRYEPAIRMVHVGGGSAPRAGLIPLMARSRLLYAQKYGGRAGELLERLAGALHALTHLALTTQGAEARLGYLKALAISLDVRGTPSSVRERFTRSRTGKR
jgi:N-acetylglucosaminyl-diphospho-decaprenol L-rhamnosyltransferase